MDIQRILTAPPCEAVVARTEQGAPEAVRRARACDMLNRAAPIALVLYEEAEMCAVDALGAARVLCGGKLRGAAKHHAELLQASWRRHRLMVERGFGFKGQGAEQAWNDLADMRHEQLRRHVWLLRMSAEQDLKRTGCRSAHSMAHLCVAATMGDLATAYGRCVVRVIVQTTGVATICLREALGTGSEGVAKWSRELLELFARQLRANINSATSCADYARGVECIHQALLNTQDIDRALDEAAALNGGMGIKEVRV